MQYYGESSLDYGIITIFDNEVTIVKHGSPEDYTRAREDSVESIIERLGIE